MRDRRTDTAVSNLPPTGKKTPPWWTDKHASSWEHVKGALERDWEQTKADFSANSGHKLNQGVADTVRQSMGSEPVPPIGVKTHMTDPNVAAEEAQKARDRMTKESLNAADTASKAHEAIAHAQVKLNEKVGEVRSQLASEPPKTGTDSTEARASADEAIAAAKVTAAATIAKRTAMVEEAGERRDDAIAKWNDAAQGVQYGYSVRTQYPANDGWDEKVEGELRGEWEALDTGTSWHVSRDGIRRGWDYAGKTKSP